MPISRAKMLAMGMLGGGASVPSPSLLFSDLFNGVNTTPLQSHTPDIGENWTIVNGAWTINTNAARSTGSASAPLYDFTIIDAGKADVAIRSNVSIIAAGFSGVIFRYTDSTHFWAALLNATTDTFQLYEYSAGFVLRDSASIALSSGVPYQIDITCNGENITATLDGANEVTYTSSANQSATKHGMRADGPAVFFMDFKVADVGFFL